MTKMFVVKEQELFHVSIDREITGDYHDVNFNT